MLKQHMRGVTSAIMNQYTGVSLIGNNGSAQISVTTVHGQTLLALRGGGWVSNLQEKALRNT